MATYESSVSTTTWVSWNDTSTSTETSSSADVWYAWVNETTSTTSVTLSIPPRIELTAEERAEQERLALERERRRLEAQQKEDAAIEKARQLLLEQLDEPNRERLHRERQIHVWSKSGKTFKIKCGRQHNIFELDSQGKEIREYCIHIRDAVPNFDNMLAQKLMIENREDDFLKIANVRQLA